MYIFVYTVSYRPCVQIALRDGNFTRQHSCVLEGERAFQNDFLVAPVSMAAVPVPDHFKCQVA